MPTKRPMKKILVASPNEKLSKNRGEIAIRILQACRELAAAPATYALYTENDDTHIALGHPDHALRLSSPAQYMEIDALVSIVKQHDIDAVHPGYGFLSESADFSRRMSSEAHAMVIGPGWGLLEILGDKLSARNLAGASGVPVLEAMQAPASGVEEVRSFARSVGFPVMVKAVDGGGSFPPLHPSYEQNWGRGIRLVTDDAALESAVDRCIGESPSKKIFAEMAAVDGFRHIEVQIVGDGTGNARHLWERDCSIQRRHQKIVEIAPALVPDRRIVVQAIEAALRMASKLNYLGLGTWEFLVNIERGVFFFLEINPRLQVEHTITEELCGIDLVALQLMIAQGAELHEEGLKSIMNPGAPPRAVSIQLRVCAEDPEASFALSIGKISRFELPSGNGVRVDTHLSRGGIVGSEFDNLVAKIVVTGPSWDQALRKARRALLDTRIEGLNKTNVNLLRGILVQDDFISGNVSTTWLENSVDKIIANGIGVGNAMEKASILLPILNQGSGLHSSLASSNVLLKKGDAWSLKIKTSEQRQQLSYEEHLVRLDRVLRNEFPTSLTADITYVVPGATPVPYQITFESTKASAEAISSTHRRGDSANRSHIVVPMTGKLIEVLVEKGDKIHENDVIAYVKQMKMELEIRTPRGGEVKWAIELENDGGDDVAEGVLLVELDEDDQREQSLAPETGRKARL